MGWSMRWYWSRYYHILGLLATLPAVYLLFEWGKRQTPRDSISKDKKLSLNISEIDQGTDVDQNYDCTTHNQETTSEDSRRPNQTSEVNQITGIGDTNKQDQTLEDNKITASGDSNEPEQESEHDNTTSEDSIAIEYSNKPDQASDDNQITVREDSNKQEQAPEDDKITAPDYTPITTAHNRSSLNHESTGYQSHPAMHTVIEEDHTIVIREQPIIQGNQTNIQGDQININSLVIEGMSKDEHETRAELERKVQELLQRLGTMLDFANVYRLPTEAENTDSAQIVVELSNTKDKEQIMMAAEKMAQSSCYKEESSAFIKQEGNKKEQHSNKATEETANPTSLSTWSRNREGVNAQNAAGSTGMEVSPSDNQEPTVSPYCIFTNTQEVNAHNPTVSTADFVVSSSNNHESTVTVLPHSYLTNLHARIKTDNKLSVNISEIDPGTDVDQNYDCTTHDQMTTSENSHRPNQTFEDNQITGIEDSNQQDQTLEDNKTTYSEDSNEPQQAFEDDNTTSEDSIQADQVSEENQTTPSEDSNKSDQTRDQTYEDSKTTPTEDSNEPEQASEDDNTTSEDSIQADQVSEENQATPSEDSNKPDQTRDQTHEGSKPAASEDLKNNPDQPSDDNQIRASKDSYELDKKITPTTDHKSQDNETTSAPEITPAIGVITEFDFNDVIQLLGPDNLQKLYQALGIRQVDIEKAQKGANTDNVELKAKAVFRLWLLENGSAATHRAILQALEKCNNTEAKENLEDSWNMKDSGIVSESNCYDVIQSLGPDELQKLYQELGIRQQDIEKAEKNANTEDVDLKARAVLRCWKKVNGKAATREAILQALEKCNKKQAKEDIVKKWNSTAHNTSSVNHESTGYQSHPAMHTVIVEDHTIVIREQPIIQGNQTNKQSDQIIVAEAPGTPDIIEIDATHMTITWIPPTSDGGSPITHYIIEKKEKKSSKWIKAHTEDVTEQTLKVQGLDEGKEYEFRVAAINNAGQGPFSVSSEPKLAKPPYVVPGAPGTPDIIEIDATHMTITWIPPTSDGGSPITHYIIEKKQKKSSKWIKAHTEDVTEQTLKVQGLGEGKEYEFRVAAINNAGQGLFSVSSEPKLAKPPYDVPDTPGKPIVSYDNDTHVTLTWTAPKSDGGSPIIGYFVEKKDFTSSSWKNVNSTPLQGLSFKLEDMVMKSKYQFRIIATNKAGNGQASEPSDASMAKVPDEFDFNDVIQLLGPDDLQKLYQALGIRQQYIEKAERGANTDNVELKARAVFRLWLQENGSAATHQAILQALAKCNNTEAKEHLEDSWNMKDSGMVSESNFYDVIQLLGPDELQKLYQALGIRKQDIEKAEKSANTEDVELKARAVLRWWKKVEGRKATREAILQALEKYNNPKAKEDIVKKWNSTGHNKAVNYGSVGHKHPAVQTVIIEDQTIVIRDQAIIQGNKTDIHGDQININKLIIEGMSKDEHETMAGLERKVQELLQKMGTQSNFANVYRLPTDAENTEGSQIVVELSDSKDKEQIMMAAEKMTEPSVSRKHEENKKKQQSNKATEQMKNPSSMSRDIEGVNAHNPTVSTAMVKIVSQTSITGDIR